MANRLDEKTLQFIREAFVILHENTAALNEARAVIESAKLEIATNKKKSPISKPSYPPSLNW